ncbi:hypothetical protein Ga0074812_12968 [Parafrankia irregularis]|uniref:DUF7660 domain-containing protein n=1 Tax=Parafrankia irregularis TaxID=795642 RepID=A0A0S4QVQ2_9ACTN|nr:MULTISPECIES: hypothetical protein [Parafrankia]MBE3202479.1 hypothetical protein [Parafrankia sp. CH37]CUU59597.1 hypothetical protein Ga0074812_12968 [Parafrankia irregularis]
MSSFYDTGRFAEVTGLDQVTTHADVMAIVNQMLADLRDDPGAWANPTLDQYLDALGACLESLPSTGASRGAHLPDGPTWRLLAEMLVKATGYE